MGRTLTLKNNDLSNQPAYCIAYHFDFLLEVNGIWPFKKLRWKTDGIEAAKFYRHLQIEDVNVMLIVPKKYVKLVEQELTNHPFQVVQPYETDEDLQRLATNPWHNIIIYYDRDTQRGPIFRDQWRDQ